MIDLIALAAIGATYYVDPVKGSDANLGTSPQNPWKSLSRVSRTHFDPGDTVLLASGALFNGSLDISTGGTSDRPVVFRSEGAPATIVSPNESAIVVRAGGIEIRNLTLRGGAKGPKKGQEGLRLSAPAASRAVHIRIESLDIAEFGDCGISIEGAPNNSNGFDDVRISKVHIHGNFGTGLTSWDTVAPKNAGYAHHGFLIRDCEVSDNLGGNGIILGGVEGATVEFCRTARNHGVTGALGMWAWCAKDVTFRYCIANGTRGKNDSGGFDLDGGCRGCIIEHCLSFDNDGPGYMHCDYPSAPRTERNKFLSSVSIDDGRAGHGKPLAFGFVVWGSGLYDCAIEGNLAVVTKPDPSRGLGGVLFAVFIRDTNVPITSQKLQNAVFRNNTVNVSAEGVAFYRNDFPAENPADVKLFGDTYRSTTATPFVEGAQPHSYATVKQWSEATGNEPSVHTSRRRKIEINGYMDLEPRDLPRFFKRLGL